MPVEEIGWKEYLDTRFQSIGEKIDSQSQLFDQHFKLNELAISKSQENLTLRCENFEIRLKSLERANAFSSGRMWMVMAIFAAIPTIIALVALIRE